MGGKNFEVHQFIHAMKLHRDCTENLIYPLGILESYFKIKLGLVKDNAF